MRKAQLSMIMVFGVVLLIVFAILFISDEKEPAAEQTSITTFESTVDSFKEYTTTCLENQAERALAYYDGERIRANERGLTPLLEDSAFVRYYLKMQASLCFNATLFSGVEIKANPPYRISVTDANHELLVRVDLITQLSQLDFHKSIDSFSFSVRKGQHADIFDLAVGDMPFSIYFPLRPINMPAYREGEAILSYKQDPLQSISLQNKLSELPILSREPFYQGVLAAYPSIENTSGPWQQFLFDELITFDESKISFEELRSALKQYPVVNDVFRSANIFSSDLISLELLQQKAFGIGMQDYNDNLYTFQWYLDNSGQFSGVVGSDIGIIGADISKNHTPIISVIDQGVFKNLDLEINYEKSFDVVNYDNDVTPHSKEEFHGTHVAGVIAARQNNSMGIVGICPHCTVLNMNIFESHTSDSRSLLNAILLSAFHQSDIISMSLGSLYFVEYEQFVISTLSREGIIFIAAAGNDGADKPNYPAGYEHVMAVGATDNADSMAAFSNYGEWVDIYAPGENIISSCSQNSFCFSSGTSMATPIVSGIVGLMLSKNQNLDQKQVLDILQQSADVTEEGLLRVNVKRALESVP